MPHRDRLKRKDIFLPLWKWGGVVLYGGNSQMFVTWAKLAMGAEPQVDSHACGHAYLEAGKPWLLWVENLTDVAALAHEALHITFGLLEARGLKPTVESEEAYTYTMEQIVRETLSRDGWKLTSPDRAPQELK